MADTAVRGKKRPAGPLIKDSIKKAATTDATKLPKEGNVNVFVSTSDSLVAEMDRTVFNLADDVKIYGATLNTTGKFLIPLLRACSKRLEKNDDEITSRQVLPVDTNPSGPEIIDLSDSTAVLEESHSNETAEPKIEDLDHCSLGVDVMSLMAKLKTLEMHMCLNSNRVIELTEETRRCQIAKQQELKSLIRMKQLKQHAISQFKSRGTDIWGNGDVPCALMTNIQTIPRRILYKAIRQWRSDFDSPPLMFLSLENVINSDTQESNWATEEIDMLFNLFVQGMTIKSNLESEERKKVMPKGAHDTSICDFVYKHLADAIAEEESVIQGRLNSVEDRYKEVKGRSDIIAEMQQRLQDLANMWKHLTESIESTKQRILGLDSTPKGT